MRHLAQADGGVYTCVIKPRQAGTRTLEVRVNGRPVNPRPFLEAAAHHVQQTTKDNAQS